MKMTNGMATSLHGFIEGLQADKNLQDIQLDPDAQQALFLNELELLKIKDSVNAVAKEHAPLPDYQTYVQKRRELVLGCAATRKDESGNEVPAYEEFPNGGYSFTPRKEKVDEYTQKLAEINETYKEALEDYEKKQTVFNSFLTKEIDVNLIEIDLKNLPNLTRNQFKQALPMLKGLNVKLNEFLAEAKDKDADEAEAVIELLTDGAGDKSSKKSGKKKAK